MKLPNESNFLSRIPTPVLVGVWLLAAVLAGGCLFWALFAPSGDTSQVASASATSTRAVRRTATPTKASQPAATSQARSATAAPTKAAATAKPVASATTASANPTPTTAPKPTNPPAATTLPINETFGYGIQVNGLNDYDAPESSINMVNQLKMTWIKQQVRWAEFEPEQGKIKDESWVILDRLVRKANKSNVKVMLSIVSAPAWSHPSVGPDPTEDPYGIKAPPDDLNAYANFVGLVVDHYKNLGYPIHAIEVWNEQNLLREWRTNPQKINAPRYLQMLRLTYQVVKSKDPNIVVISGALSPTGCDDGITCVDDFKYLQQMVDAGLLDNTDCVGAHHNGYNIGPDVTAQTAMQNPKAATANFKGPFTAFNNGLPHHSWFFNDTLQTYIKIVNGKKPLCVTEFGWPSSDGITTPVRQGFEFSQDNTLQEQATYITQAFKLMNQWGFVKLAFLWNLNFFTVTDDPTTTDNAIYSILTPAGMPRPAFDALGAMPKP
jgi:hypothetical protein